MPMTAPSLTPELKLGDTVRIRNPEHFLAAFAAKVRDRDGVVEWVGPDRHGNHRNHVTVRFGKRNGRGKEFSERMHVRDLVLQPATPSSIAST